MAGLTVPPVAAQAPAAGLAFTGVTVIDVRHGQRIPEQTVLVVGNRIQSIGRADVVRLPQATQVVDARGKYLIPGLWNMHVHLFGRPNSMYRYMLANGVTGMREAGSEISLDTFKLWKREIAAGTLVGPRQIVSGRSIDECEPPNHFDYHICAPTPAAARRLVDSFARAGADMIKTYSVSPAMYGVIAAEARRLGIPFGGHHPQTRGGRLLDGRDASDSGALILDHRTGIPVCGEGRRHAQADLAKCTAAAARLRRNGTWVTDLLLGFPSGTFPDSILETLQYYAWRPLSDEERRRPLSLHGALVAANAIDSATGFWSGCGTLTTKHAANLPALANTDIGHPGFGLHVYLGKYVACGATALWALQTATLNPAQALRATDSLGTVAPGKMADLVLLDGDPLAEIWNVTKIWAVVANGRYFDRTALDRLLLEAQAAREVEEKTLPDATWEVKPPWERKKKSALDALPSRSP